MPDGQDFIPPFFAAAAAALAAVEHGCQVAIMAPTEILAEQHWRNFSAWFHPLGVEPAWLAYLLVDDVDKTARKVLKAEGAVLVPPQRDGFNEDVAIVADPTGGVFALQHRRAK